MLDHVVLLVVVPEHQQPVSQLRLARTDAGGEFVVAHALVTVGQGGLPQHGHDCRCVGNWSRCACTNSWNWYMRTGTNFLSFAA